jgi:hypothetical protein
MSRIGNCMGHKDEGFNVVVKPHTYIDGGEHEHGSHTLCPDCANLYRGSLQRAIENLRGEIDE